MRFTATRQASCWIHSGGYPDLAQRHVRFIGNAQDRIREDYLRILRFFRFTAEYAEGAPDAEGLAACAELREGMARLSAERVRGELLRLLAAPRALDLVRAMDDAGVLSQILPGLRSIASLQRLVEIEHGLNRAPDALLRLASLCGAKPGEALRLREKLRLSNMEADRIADAALAAQAIARGEASEVGDRVTLYRHGREAYHDGLLLAQCLRESDGLDLERLSERLSLLERWVVPELPVRGQDIMDAGLVSGPAVGRVLRDFEAWWIAEGFPTGRNTLAHALSKFVKRERGES